MYFNNFGSTKNKENQSVDIFRFSDKLYFATGGNSNFLEIFEINGFDVKKIVDFTLEDKVNSLSFSEGFIIVGTSSGFILIYKFEDILSNISNKELIRPNHCNGTHNSRVCHIYTDGRNVISSSWDGLICGIGDNYNFTLLYPSFYSWCSTLSEDKSFLIACGGDKCIRFFDYKKGDLIYTLEGAHESPVRCIKIYNSKLYSLENNGILREWSISNELKLERKLEVSSNLLYCMSIDNNIIYVGGESRLLYMIDIESFQIIDCFPLNGAVRSVSFLDNALVCVTERGMYGVFSNNRRDEIIQEYESELSDIYICDSILEQCNIKSFPTKPDPACSTGDIAYIRDDKNVRYQVFSKGYNRWVVFGNLKLKESKGDGDNCEYDSCFSIEKEDGTAYQFYFKVDDTIDEQLKAFLEKNNITSENHINQIKSFITSMFGLQFKE